MVGAPPPKLTEITETPDNRWFAPEKLWAGTHPINQGIAILAAAVVLVVAVQNAGKLRPLVMAYFGRAPREGTSDAPKAFVPPPEPTEAEKRNDELREILYDVAKKLQKVDQNVYNLTADVRLMDSKVGDMNRRIGDIETRLTTAVTREEMGIALNLVSDLARRS